MLNDKERYFANAKRKRIPFAIAPHNIILLLALLVIIALMSKISPYFLTISNLLESTRFIAEIGFIAIGMTVVILTGGIDLSVGSILALSSIVLGVLINEGFNEFLAVAISLSVGIASGIINGLIISLAKIPPIIVTLGTMAVYRGLAIGISRGNSYRIPESFLFLGQSDFMGVPLQFILLTAFALIFHILIRRTVLGRTIVAIGNNEKAALFSGLRISLSKTLVYGASGFMCAVAALIFSSRVISAKASFGIGYELDAITIVVLGGASLAGGKINIFGTILGLIIIGLTRRGLSMAIVASEVQAILIGIILIAAVTINRLFSERPKKRYDMKLPINDVENV
jgi:rhamnose transport system permease protein